MSETEEKGVKTRSQQKINPRLVSITDLIKKRFALRGRLSLFENFIAKLEAPITSSQKIEVDLRVKTVLTLYNEFEDIQTKIEEESSDSELAIQLEEREAFEERYYKALSIAKGYIDEETGDKFHTSTISKKPLGIKLPEIKLPAFDGSYDHWLEFKNSYLTMIHNRTDLGPIQKFHYLKSSVSGTAAQVISALEFTTENYSHAWELLENRFNNYRLLLHNHIKSLFNVPPVRQESPTQIRKLIDGVHRDLRALKSLGEPTDSWDTLIIYLIVSKLDSTTERDWEQHLGSSSDTVDKQPTKHVVKLEDLLKFLSNKADMLDMVISNIKNTQPNKFSNENKKQSTHHKQNNSSHSYVVTQPTKHMSNVKASTQGNRKCVMCKNNHSLYACSTFLNLAVNDRIKFVVDKNLCKNCFRMGHSDLECYFGPCKQCNKKHNSLIHPDTSDIALTSNARDSHVSPTNQEDVRTNTTALHAASMTCNYKGTSTRAENSLSTVLLSTALVSIADGNNKCYTARALLDNGSQHCFITKSFCDKVNAKVIQSTFQVTGVGHSVTQTSHSCKIALYSKTSDYNTRVQCLVLPCISDRLPSVSIDFNAIQIPNDIQLADPRFFVPSEIDLLIGADKFWELLDEDRIQLSTGPYLQSTKLGWVISGSVNNKRSPSNKVQCNFSQTIDAQLRRFWELEEITQSSTPLTQDERACEKIFATTTTRNENGRFSVRIPLKESADALGESFSLATKRFRSLERKLEHSPEFKEKYHNFMMEYERLGHMTRVNSYTSPHYFLPHHGVINENSTTTKLRTVFDASAVTSSGKSLNDIQYTGPALQNDLLEILLRFRQYKHVACADVEKMYRQILVQPDQRNLQLILWRSDPSDPLSIYRLNTVTYGTASAPYLSIRCLKQIALELEDKTIARVINEDFYVDDLITGHDDPVKLMEICDRTAAALSSACFPLRKWLFNIDVSAQDTFKGLCLGEQTQGKTLGLGWHSSTDELYFITRISYNNSYNSQVSKRIMLSVISQVYDPLGLVAPAIILAKVLLQKLWLHKLNWDDPVPVDILPSWTKFINSLNYLENIKIPRHVIEENSQYMDLHIFTDASQSAYGACAYVRSYSKGTPSTVRLLCAKSKVAPVKTISIPRLELCGALVGAKLYNKIKKSIRLQFNQVYFWTDSTIVLGWLRMSPHLMKTFVQNRVTEINELTSDTIWSHVTSEENPADLLSRGLPLDALNRSDLWWTGPTFLKNHNDTTRSSAHVGGLENLPELKSQVASMMCEVKSVSVIEFARFSSFNRLRRAFAYVLRFIKNSRTQAQNRALGALSLDELTASAKTLVKCVQRQSFSDIYYNVKNLAEGNKKKWVKTNRNVKGLNVFLDTDNLIRVGGRLSNSVNYDFNKKHPLLLCGKHIFTQLLFRHTHLQQLHAGPQLLLSTIREEWWPLGGRNLARKTVDQCVLCTRLKGKTLTPLMGNLPSERIESGFPFLRCGVDYAGPVFVLNRKGRGSKLEKCYICLFICLSTRAIHLELVTSLTTEAFLLALKRFISRRGKPAEISSDNGTTFVGAMRELSGFFKNNSREIIDHAVNENIKFKFIPPYSPHFGGLWEAGVKSCKYHLRRVLGNAHLTYEEFSTVLTQIEAVLNSRPMYPMSTDPNDLLPLTPAHFLIGRPLTAPACEDLTTCNSQRLSRYDRIEQIRQHFWQRWSKEYISELQVRKKWKTQNPDLELDSLVVVKEDNLPPLKWRLGRIVHTFTGRDGVSRVASIRTSSGTLQRAFSKICPLPPQTVSDDNSA